MWPLHGSPAYDARLIMRSSTSPSSASRMMSATAACRATPSGVMTAPGRRASMSAMCAIRGCSSAAASRSDGVLSLDIASGLRPARKPGGHGYHILITHLLHRIGGERRAIPARAVDHDLPIARDDRLDLRLEGSARNVHRPREVAEIPFVRLAHVEVDGVLTARLHLEDLRRRHLADALLRFIDQVHPRLLSHGVLS